ncbi:MAG TPA: EamA family transporter [Candidatus Dormibacteraeota bacterium]|nr:EamA family transporter [Candidatus Dormibacteraeota bacterium]
MTTLVRSSAINRLGGRVIGAFAIVYVIWGSTYLFIRLASETIPPLLMAGVRFLVAGAILLALTSRMRGRQRDPIGRRQWGATAVTGALLLLGGNGGVAYGEQFVASGTVALLVATVPLFIALFSALFLGQRLRRVAVIGIGVGLLGTAVLIRPGGGNADPGHMLLVLAAPLTWAIGSLYATRGPLPKRLLVATGMEMLCGGALLVVAGLLAGELPSLHLDRISLVSGLSLAYLVVFGSLIAFSAYVWLLSKVPTQAVATYAYVNPLVAVLLGWAFLGEPITGQTLLAAALIIVAVVLILSRSPVQSRRAPVLPKESVA